MPVPPYILEARNMFDITGSQLESNLPAYENMNLWGGMDRHEMLRTECLCPPQIHTLPPNPQGDGIRRWRLWEVIRGQSRHKWG